MSKRIISFLALLIIVFAVQACNFPSTDRASEPPPPETPSPEPLTTEAPESEEPPPPVEPIDCGDDLECFSDAAENCTLATVEYAIPIDMIGILITSTTYQEILGPEEGLCVFLIRTEDVTVEYGDEVIQQLLDSGLTQEQIEEQRVMAEEQAKQAGLDDICRAEPDKLMAVINQWSQGNFPLEDWEGIECEG